MLTKEVGYVLCKYEMRKKEKAFNNALGRKPGLDKVAAPRYPSADCQPTLKLIPGGMLNYFMEESCVWHSGSKITVRRGSQRNRRGVVVGKYG